MLGRIGQFFQHRPISDEEFCLERERIIREIPAPVLWMLGKTGSGKTSVVHHLTGAAHAEIGNGYRPRTASSRLFDFPAAENPLIRFLDTRGLGETHYDPAEDITAFHDMAHLILVTARVMDHALADVVAPLSAIRKVEPHRPVLLLLTCLHEAYPQAEHPAPDPFDGSLTPDTLPQGLRDSIERQAERFRGLVDRIVPIDLTAEAEGFAEPNFGGDRLKSALVDLLPTAQRQSLASLEAAVGTLGDLNQRRAAPYIVAYSSMSATAAAIPIPWVDIPFVIAIQSHLVHQLAKVYGQPLGAEGFLKMAGAVGTRLVTRMALKSLTKSIPVVGAAANAAVAYFYTYALGTACCWYFGQVRRGNVPTEPEIEEVWRDELQRAAGRWRSKEVNRTQ